jgi:hypothetical protein
MSYGHATVPDSSKTPMGAMGDKASKTPMGVMGDKASKTPMGAMGVITYTRKTTIQHM